GPDRHRDDRRHPRPDLADPGRPAREARGGGGGGRVPLLHAGGVHHRRGGRRQRRLPDRLRPPVADTMRVAELPGVGEPLRIATRPVPEPGPGQALVRVEACGVCGSDLFLRKGGFGPGIRMPVVPGHESPGVVAALGPGVTGVQPGDQVAIYYIDAPADSVYARRGRPNIGPGVVRMGVDVDGAFAEYVLRPA